MTTTTDFNNKNFEELTTKKMTAKEMALCSHHLSPDAKYARKHADNSLWIWSDVDWCWKQVG